MAEFNFVVQYLKVKKVRSVSKIFQGKIYALDKTKVPYFIVQVLGVIYVCDMRFIWGVLT